MLCFRNFLVAEKFMDERGVGVGIIKIFRRKFFVSECRKVSSSNLSVLQKFFFYRKVSGKREGAGIRIFVKIVLSHSTEKLRR